MDEQPFFLVVDSAGVVVGPLSEEFDSGMIDLPSVVVASSSALASGVVSP